MAYSRVSAVRRSPRRAPTPAAWLAELPALIRRQVRPGRGVLHLAVLLVGGLSIVASTALRVAQQPSEPVVVPVEAAAPAAVAEVVEAQPASAESVPEPSRYVVQPGDTLNRLAERFGVSVATIAAANKLDDPDRIAEGQELVVLPVNGILYEVKDPETLEQIAQRYGADVTEIARFNRLQPEASKTVEHRELIVPGVEPALPGQPSRLPAVGNAREPSTPANQRETTLASLAVGASGEATETKRPAPRRSLTYTVQDGDSLNSLAAQFGVSVRTILLANNIQDPDLVKIGTELRVLPVSGVEHEVNPGETLADIAEAYAVDLGPIIDFNGLTNPDLLRDGTKLIIPGATARVAVPVVVASAQRSSNPSESVVAIAPQVQGAARAAAPAQRAEAPARVLPAPSVGGGGASVAKNAMNFIGYSYVFGGTSPAGFDCSGFVYYVHQISGAGTSRGMWGQLNGGPRIARENLQPGDTVFFANTYMPGLSHNGIYLGGGRFIHAIDPSRGVGISSLSDGYWASRYVGAARLW